MNSLIQNLNQSRKLQAYEEVIQGPMVEVTVEKIVETENSERNNKK